MKVDWIRLVLHLRTLVVALACLGFLYGLADLAVGAAVDLTLVKALGGYGVAVVVAVAGKSGLQHVAGAAAGVAAIRRRELASTPGDEEPTPPPTLRPVPRARGA